MQTIINRVHAIFANEEAARKIAVANTEDGDGWDYRVEVDPKGSGRAVIRVFDEDGVFVGLL